jgi:uncharacterized protein YggT (Ycf19 family)
MYPDPPSSPNPNLDEPNQVARPLPEKRTPRPGPSQIMMAMAKIVWLIVVIILLLLAIRVGFSLIGANPDNQFASFIYAITTPLIEPFRGLLQVGEYRIGVARFEFETLVAMFVYLMVGWAITAVIRISGK